MMIKNLGVRHLAEELGVTHNRLKLALYAYRRERQKLGGMIQASLPSETTMRKWFSSDATPSHEGLGFLLEFIHDEHQNVPLKYSEHAFQKIRDKAKSLKGSILVYENLAIEHIRRRKYHVKLSEEIDSKYVGVYVLVRERSNGELAAEPIIIMERDPDNASTHRASYWFVGGYIYCGDIIFGYRSAGGVFVIKSTDKPLNPICINICLPEGSDEKNFSAKVTTTNPLSGDIYSKNAMLLNISEILDTSDVVRRCKMGDLSSLKEVRDYLGYQVKIATDVVNYVKMHTPNIRRYDASNIVNSIDGVILSVQDSE